MTIYKYVIVNDCNEVISDSGGYDDFQKAKKCAEKMGGLVAVVKRAFEYSDSALVWTSDGSDIWPPEDLNESEKECYDMLGAL